mgnify:CR=1 FL=1
MSEEFIGELRSAARYTVPEIIETMFFSEVAEVDSMPCQDPCWNISMRFRGTPSGRFHLRLERGLAAELAGSFLGDFSQEIGAEREKSVACELANMVCGSILSRAESDTGFELSSPEPVEGSDSFVPEYRSVFVSETGGVIELAFGELGDGAGSW